MSQIIKLKSDWLQIPGSEENFTLPLKKWQQRLELSLHHRSVDETGRIKRWLLAIVRSAMPLQPLRCQKPQDAFPSEVGSGDGAGQNKEAQHTCVDVPTSATSLSPLSLYLPSCLSAPVALQRSALRLINYHH